MIDEEGRSPIEVSNIIAGHNRGNTEDTATLAKSVTHFSEQYGLDLAGVNTSPNADSVSSEGTTGMQRVTELSQGIHSSSDNNRAHVERELSRSGVPQAESIQDNVTFIMDQSISEMNTTTNTLDKGVSKASREGDTLESIVHDKQDIYSSGAAPSIHKTMNKARKKLTNTFKDVFD